MDSEKKKLDNTDYTKCCFNQTDGKSCGKHSKSRLSGIFSCNTLIELVTADKILEKELIESRIFKEFNPDDKICAFHRQKYGIYWKVPNRCLHPVHINSVKNRLKKQSYRQATQKQYEIINIQYPRRFPMFGNLCGKHRDCRKEIIEDEEEDAPFLPPLIQSDNSFNTDDVNNFLEISAPDVSPIKWHLNKTLIKEASLSSTSYHLLHKPNSRDAAHSRCREKDS